jgi:CMP-N-acetylneuraminic acid synthetase
MRFEIAALMPLKANSVRVPHKNFRDFQGRPLVHWMLGSLLSLDWIEVVVINTDARAELACVGVEDGSHGGRVLIRDRRPELCGDAVSMNRVLADDLAHVEAETYLMTHTTNPLLSARTISAALAAYRESGCDSLFTVNCHQTRFYRADGSAVNHDPQNLVPTQDLEPWFEENSNLYIFTRESFAATGARIGARPHMFVTPRLESLDIDTLEDWMMAEAAATVLGGSGVTGT